MKPKYEDPSICTSFSSGGRIYILHNPNLEVGGGGQLLPSGGNKKLHNLHMTPLFKSEGPPLRFKFVHYLILLAEGDRGLNYVNY